MSVKNYSLRKDGDTNLSKDFKVREFRCKDGSDTVLISTETVQILQKIRDYFGKPITINSAYRTATYNKKVGGASKSQHVKGTACDIVVKDVPPNAVASYLEATHSSGGIGLYSTFVHVDTRGYKVLWLNNGSSVVTSFRLGDLYKKYKAPVEKGEEMTEKDVKRIVEDVLNGNDTLPSNWIKNSGELKTAIDLGITDGTRPRGYASREEVWAMIVRALEIKDMKNE